MPLTQISAVHPGRALPEDREEKLLAKRLQFRAWNDKPASRLCQGWCQVGTGPHIQPATSRFLKQTPSHHSPSSEPPMAPRPVRQAGSAEPVPHNKVTSCPNVLLSRTPSTMAGNIKNAPEVPALLCCVLSTAPPQPGEMAAASLSCQVIPSGGRKADPPLME